MSIQLQGVSREFGGQRVLSPLTFSIESGEFLTLLGPSGCGKSTLLRIIAGLDGANSGRLEFDHSLLERGRRSFVFQESHLLPWRTALANVMLPLELTGFGSQDEALTSETSRGGQDRSNCREQRAMAALTRVGLRDAAKLFPHELSGGMKMRVSVARALVTEPRLLLLDEPFAALDESTRYSLQEDLRALWREFKMTVVFVTHSLNEAVFLSTRTLVLTGRPAGILSDQKSPLAIERDFKTRTSPEFNAEVDRLHGLMSKGELRGVR